MKKIAKSKRPEAERAAEHVAVEVFGCAATRRALRTKFAKVDFFGCDVMGFGSMLNHYWIQVTAGQIQAVQTRRKKLEKYPWAENDEVYVMQLVERAKVDNPRQKEWFFRVWHLDRMLSLKDVWHEEPPIPIKREWFKARKDDA